MTAKKSETLSPEVAEAYFAPIELEAHPPKPHAASPICEDFRSFAKRAEEMGLDLVNLSDLNLLNFYRVDLQMHGFQGLPVLIRKKFRKLGLVSRAGTNFSLTDRAKRLLAVGKLGVCSFEQNPTPRAGFHALRRR